MEDEELLSVLSRYTGKPDPSFTSENQKNLLRAVLKPKYANVIAILPTGSGKSIAIFAPILAEETGVSVVITPHCALRQQLADQAKAFGICHLVWNQRNESNAPDQHRVRLVIMISDDFATEEAQTWVCSNFSLALTLTFT